MVSFPKTGKGIEQKASNGSLNMDLLEKKKFLKVKLQSQSQIPRVSRFETLPYYLAYDRHFFSEKQKESNTNLHFFPEGKIIFLSLARP